MVASDFTKPNPEFDLWKATLPATHWAKYDLSACRLGWEAALANLPSGLGDLESEYIEWVKATFPDETVGEQMVHLREEFQELMDDPGKPDEYADVIMLLLLVARRLGIDVKSAWRQKLEINKGRVWEKTDRGYRHVCDQKSPAPSGVAQERRACPKVVCLCGSSKWPMIHAQAMMLETLAGNIVIPMGLYGHADFPPGAKVATNDGDESTEVKRQLDRLHFRKIDLAEEILVVRVDGYIGTSTSREITYAQLGGKAVRYFDRH